MSHLSADVDVQQKDVLRQLLKPTTLQLCWSARSVQVFFLAWRSYSSEL